MAAATVLVELPSTIFKAGAAAGFIDEQRRIAEAALTGRRRDVLGGAKTIRKALEAVRVNSRAHPPHVAPP